MLQEINNKVLFYISCLFAAYFGFLLLDAYVLKLTFVLVGFFRELLTIPAVLLLPLMLIFTFIRWWKEKFHKGYLLGAIIVLFSTALAITFATVLE